MRNAKESTGEGAQLAILNESAANLLAVLPRSDDLPFTLVFVAEALVEAAEKFPGHVGLSAPETGAKATLSFSHHFKFYGVSSDGFQSLLIRLRKDFGRLESLLERKGTQYKGTDVVRKAAFLALSGALDDAKQDDTLIVSRVLARLEPATLPGDDGLVRCFVEYMGEQRPRFERWRAVLLACQQRLGTRLCSDGQEYEDLVGELPTMLDEIANAGAPDLDAYHVHLLGLLYESVKREPPDDLKNILRLARANFEAACSEKAREEGTLELGQFRVFEQEEEESGDDEDPAVSPVGQPPEASKEPRPAGEESELRPCPTCNGAGADPDTVGECLGCNGTGRYSAWEPYLQEVFGFDTEPCDSCNATGQCSTCDGSGTVAEVRASSGRRNNRHDQQVTTDQAPSAPASLGDAFVRLFLSQTQSQGAVARFLAMSIDVLVTAVVLLLLLVFLMFIMAGIGT